MMIRMISKEVRQRKIAMRNCISHPHSHRALHVITVLELNTAFNQYVNSNTRDTSSNRIKSD